MSVCLTTVYKLVDNNEWKFILIQIETYFSTLKITKMKSKNFFFLFIFAISIMQLNAQENIKRTEIEQISETLTDYIEGSTNGQPARLKKAFHSDLNLYYAKDNKLKTWSGKAYIEDTKEGKPTGETGKIISIDYENDIATAKVQISSPESKTPYVDYFMLIKIEGHWTIIHKMFTKRVNK